MSRNEHGRPAEYYGEYKDYNGDYKPGPDPRDANKVRLILPKGQIESKKEKEILMEIYDEIYKCRECMNDTDYLIITEKILNLVKKLEHYDLFNPLMWVSTILQYDTYGPVLLSFFLGFLMKHNMEYYFQTYGPQMDITPFYIYGRLQNERNFYFYLLENEDKLPTLPREIILLIHDYF